jgi:hypothetical protein
MSRSEHSSRDLDCKPSDQRFLEPGGKSLNIFGTPLSRFFSFFSGYGYEESVGAALSRMGATTLSFVCCFIYLLFFPFHLWGLAILIGVGAVAMSLLSRPDDIITTGITTAVVMSSQP